MLQEVFLVVTRRLGDYNEQGRVRAWLYSICTRVARGYRRKAARVRESLNSSVVEQVSEPSQLTQAEDRQALVLGYELLSLISPEQREVFVLYEVEDMTMAEIAEALSLPLQTGYSRLHRARALILAAVQRSTSEDGHG
jgi:RNA polymerase sigma-70 factor (ECF subfamily)